MAGGRPGPDGDLRLVAFVVGLPIQELAGELPGQQLAEAPQSGGVVVHDIRKPLRISAHRPVHVNHRHVELVTNITNRLGAMMSKLEEPLEGLGKTVGSAPMAGAPAPWRCNLRRVADRHCQQHEPGPSRRCERLDSWPPLEVLEVPLLMS